MCLKCQKFGHYASQCHDKKGKGKQQLQKQFAGSAEASAGVDELSSKLETHFSMVSCMSSNTVLKVLLSTIVCGQWSLRTYEL